MITLRSYTSPYCSTRPRGQDLSQPTTVSHGGEILHYTTKVMRERTSRADGTMVSDLGTDLLLFHVLQKLYILSEL